MTISNTSSVGGGASAASGNGSGATIANNFDQFLTLLTTQLKNQSPLDPLNTNEFTAQLVQFAGVEQQLRTNETLSSLLNLNKAGMTSTAVSFVGSTVTADGASTQLADGKASWNISLPRAATATVTITNAAGSVVQSFQTSFPAGEEVYHWDGTTSTGVKAPDGQYTISVDARDVSGAAMTATTQIKGVVDGVDFTGDTPMLKIGTISVPLDRVKSVVRDGGAG